MHMKIQLDDVQTRAADHHVGSMLLVAGAGSGKTATIVERAARMIERGADPQRMLMLTFSRKACREMFARLRERLGVEGRDVSKMPVIETYHSFGFKLLKKHPELCGRQDNPSLLDEADARKLFRQALKLQTSHDLSGIEPALRAVYEHIRNDGYDPLNTRHADAISSRLSHQGIEAFLHPHCLACFADYERAKAEANAVDYGDLQVLPITGLNASPQWLGQLGRYFVDIVVDESQDTNTVQYALVHMIGHASAQPQVTMVGDDDQSIYGWRGARADNLRRFIQDFKPELIRLERNYRSTEAIVNPTAQLIQCNQNRVAKKPYSALENVSAPIAYYGHPNGELMADRIAHWLKRSIDAGTPPRELAVLYRTNRMARVLEPALLARGVPYHIQQGFDLFNRQEIQMLMACVRLATNPRDFMAFQKLAPMVKGFGDKRVERIVSEFRCDPNCSNIFDKATELLGLKSAVGQSVSDLGDRIERLRSSDPVASGIGAWALDPAAGNFGPWLKQLAAQASNPRKNLETRLESLLQVDKAIQSRLSLMDVSALSLSERWGAVMETGLSTPDEDEDHRDSVTLSSIHKMKGLEFQFVHIAGFSEPLMPSMKVHEQGYQAHPDDIEEERRLAYVAMTRAKRNLVLHHASRLYLGYTTLDMQPSRFAEEAGIPLQMHAMPTRLDVDIAPLFKPLTDTLEEMGWSEEDFSFAHSGNKDTLHQDALSSEHLKNPTLPGL